ncbi:MAG: hypothetical protein IT430_16970 [Phycisphaerales bacterium]|nr:hypothetical protein [Phycisphaerales bacterium]
MNLDMDPFGRTFNRLLAIFGLSLAFVAMASILSPRTSSAGSAGVSSPEGPAVLGRLIGREHEIVVSAGDAGPRYSVYDANGMLLAERLTIEQLGRQFDGLDRMVMQMMGPNRRIGVVDDAHERSVIGDR